MLGLRQQLDRGARIGVGGDGGHIGVHDLGGGLHRRARLFDRGAGSDPERDRVDHVAGDHRLGGADASGGVAAGAGVGEDGRAGRGKGIEAAGQQGGGDAGEHVAGARRRQGRRRERVDRDPLAVGDDRVVALEHDDGAGGQRRLARRGEAVGGDLLGGAVEQAPQLAGMGREDRRRLAAGDPPEPRRRRR